jgi:hypothetical protein
MPSPRTAVLDITDICKIRKDLTNMCNLMHFIILITVYILLRINMHYFLIFSVFNTSMRCDFKLSL